MPELPEVETVKRELHKRLVGLVVRSVEVRNPKVVSVGPQSLNPKRPASFDGAQSFTNLLQGERIMGVERRAKLLKFIFSNLLLLLVHLKMTGQFIFEDKSLHKKTQGKYRILNKLSASLVELPYKHTHVIFHFTDGSRMFFNDVRKFGYLKIVRGDEIGQVKELQEYGPEPLSKSFTLCLFRAGARKVHRLSVKQLLMNNKVVVGIGNIYSDEILFYAKVDPRKKASDITEEELISTYKNIRTVLKKGIAAKGSSVGDFIRTDGSWGSMGKYHFVYGRKGQPCKICDTKIESAKLGGRTSSFCPKCQK